MTSKIEIINRSNLTVHIFGVSEWCYSCSLTDLVTLETGITSDLFEIIEGPSNYLLSIYNNDTDTFLGKFTYSYGETGQYSVYLDDDWAHYQVNTLLAPEIPVIPWLAILGLFVSIYVIFECYRRILLFMDSRSQSISSNANEESLLPTKESFEVPVNDKKDVASSRLSSLDSFRGFCLCLMIFVNYGGGGYWFFNHSPWNGITVADLLFPWFIWIMGVSLAISIESSLKKKIAKEKILYQLLIRSIKLILVGMFINNGFTLDNWRFLGVLQYFGISGLIVGTLGIYVDSHLVKSVIMIGILIIYLLIQYCLPLHYVDDILYGDYSCPTGYVGVGGIGDYSKYPHCTGGAHRYIDIKIFGYFHMYHGGTSVDDLSSNATCKDLYKCDIYDPEGVLGMLTASFLCFLGFCAGRILIEFQALKKTERISEVFYTRLFPIFFTVGSILSLAAGGLCSFRADGGLIPLNKNLWSLSFVFLTGGLGYLSLAVFFYVIDIKNYWSGAPFYYPGMNSIAIYTLSEVLSNFFPFSYNHSNTHLSTLFSNSISVLVFIAIAAVMFHKKIFIKL